MGVSQPTLPIMVWHLAHKKVGVSPRSCKRPILPFLAITALWSAQVEWTTPTKIFISWNEPVRWRFMHGQVDTRSHLWILQSQHEFAKNLRVSGCNPLCFLKHCAAN